MGESVVAAPADGNALDDSSVKDACPNVIDVAAQGDIILHVTFETSLDTLRRSRKAALATSRKAGPSESPLPHLQPEVRVAYRVSLETLKKHSKYFSNLLSNSQFREAKLIKDAHESLKAKGIKPSAAPATDLPWIAITDDDEATKTAGREHIFEDILLIIHYKPPGSSRMTMAYVSTLAITADRFDCTAAVAKYLNQNHGDPNKRFKWPVTSGNRLLADVEEVLRQKILVSWFLGQHMRLMHATREIIIRGSRCWSAYRDEDCEMGAVWWNLPDGLEHELQNRRECILNTIASVQSHFINLYSSKERQCKLGYDSSAACDSFQLGQMLKFLISKNLLFLVDFSPSSLDSLPDTSILDIEELLVTLKQCPNYQVDKNHTNCGLRIRTDPILNYIRAMLSANVVSIPLSTWSKNRADVAWLSLVSPKKEGRFDDGHEKKFAFTRALASDARLQYEGAIYADKAAKKLFTSATWDWTPEY